MEVSIEPGIVRVDDDGPGVPDDEKLRVFEPFVTGDKSRSRSLGGVGLGLSLVEKAARRWQAKVRVVDSSLGGASFIVEQGPRA